MAGLSTFLKVGSVFAMATGTMDVLLGAQTLENTSGVPFPINTPAAVLADSQLRFLGGIWAGYGLMLWWAASDLRARRVPLALLGGVMVFGGIGRSISGALYGFGSSLIVGFTAIELIVPPVVLLLGDWR